MKSGIILGIDLCDYKSELKQNDLVCIDGEFFNLEKIDPRWNKEPGEPDTLNKYFVRSKVNGELMNFERNEISKSNIAIFDSKIWFDEGKKIRLGNVTPSDLRAMRAKVMYEWDLPINTIDTINDEQLLEHIFNGTIVEKEITNYENPSTKIQYFKLLEN